MKIDNNEINKVIDLSKNVPLPRPIPPIECHCGCGHRFQPRRRDQVYLNKQHADYDYNHNTRKINLQNSSKDNKILMSNDRILEKHFKVRGREECVICYYDILKSDGFNFAYHIGRLEKDKQDYYYLYNYYYHIYVLDNIKMIKIYKR